MVAVLALLIGAQAGTTPFYTAVYEVLDGNEQNPRIKLFETFGATVQALKAGDVDLVLTDSVAAKGYVDASQGGLKVVGGALGAEDFGFIYPKGSDLVQPINAAIAALKGATIKAGHEHVMRGAGACGAHSAWTVLMRWCPRQRPAWRRAPHALRR